jgi:hypothetical protein
MQYYLQQIANSTEVVILSGNIDELRLVQGVQVKNGDGYLCWSCYTIRRNTGNTDYDTPVPFDKVYFYVLEG